MKKNNIKIKKKQSQKVYKDPINTSPIAIDNKPDNSPKEIHIGDNNLFYEKITWNKFKKKIKFSK